MKSLLKRFTRQQTASPSPQGLQYQTTESISAPTAQPVPAMQAHANTGAAVPGPNGKVNVAYFVNWGIYARNYKPFESQVPVESLTHILYAFANIRETGEVFLTDQWADEQIHYDGDSWNDPDASTNLYGNLKQLHLLKQRHRHLKVLLSIGGWTYSNNFAGPASTSQGRRMFVESSIKLLEDYALDGLDIDWEYPKNDAEAWNYVELLRDLRQGLDAHAARKGLSTEQGYELTIAAPCGAANYEKLKLKEMDEYLSMWLLMSYDYSGSWDTVTGHQAALSDNGSPTSTSTDRTIRHFASQGVPVSKLVLGIPLYGRSFLNTDNGPGNVFQGVGQGSWEQGTYDFKALPLAGSTEGYDPNLVAAWCYEPLKREWVTYDSLDSALAKAQFVNVNGLAGCMYWEASGDRQKGSGQSIIENVANVLRTSRLDDRQNCLQYKESKWTNIRQGMA
ncbi:Chitinase 4 [Microbotryomycetes sp. JL201]|nr:Chitinase 4 [Microbotryomycetes sp. JL201]